MYTEKRIKYYLPVRHGFDQYRCILFNRIRPGLHTCMIHSKKVIPIYTERLYPIARATSSNSIADILFYDRCGNGISIVTANMGYM